MEGRRQQYADDEQGQRKKSRQLYWALGILLLWAVWYAAIQFHLVKS